MKRTTSICTLILLAFSCRSATANAALTPDSPTTALSALVSKIPSYLWQATYAPVAQGFKADCRDLTDSTATLPSRIKGALHLLSSIIAHVPFEGILRACCLNDRFFSRFAGITTLTKISESNDSEVKQIATQMNIDGNTVWLADIPTPTRYMNLLVGNGGMAPQTWNKNIVWLGPYRQTNLTYNIQSEHDKITIAHELAHIKRNSSLWHIAYALGAPIISNIAIKLACGAAHKSLTHVPHSNNGLIRSSLEFIKSGTRWISTSSLVQFMLAQLIQKKLQCDDEIETDIRGALENNLLEAFIHQHKTNRYYRDQEWNRKSIMGKTGALIHDFFDPHPSADTAIKKLKMARKK